jgi:hypothetical protein
VGGTFARSTLFKLHAQDERGVAISHVLAHTGRNPMHMTRFALILVAGLALILGGGINGSASAEEERDSLYIGDGSDNSVKRFDATTGAYLGAFVNSNSGLDGPRGIIFVAGNLLLVNQNVDRPFPGEILQYSRQTGQFLGALVPCNPPFNRTCDRHAPFAPRGLIRGLGHTLYVADLGDFTTTNPGRVAHFDTITGAFLGNLDHTGFTGQFFPRGVVFGPDDRLYVSVVGNLAAGDGLTGAILRFNPHTGRFIDVFTSNQASGCAQDLHRPEGLTFGPDGKLYVTSFRADASDTDKILIFSPDKTCVDKIDLDQVGQARFFGQALVFGPQGFLFVPGFQTGEVRRYNVVTKTFTTFVPPGHLQNPWYLTFGNTNPVTLAYGPS